MEQEARPTTFINELNNAFDKTVYWRKNFLPTGAAGKCFINDMMQINPWVYNAPIKSIALKALHVMPTWLMQKPSKNSKSKNHLKLLERRLEIWKEGNLNVLYEEGRAIQDRLKSDGNPHEIVKISKKFKFQMQKGNVNGVLKILTNIMSSGILPLTDESLQLLELKQPSEKDTS